MSKSDLKARPIFHRKRDAIEAHLTVVMAALAMQRVIEKRTKLSKKKFINTLKPLHSGLIVINGITYPTEPEISKDIQQIIKALKTRD